MQVSNILEILKEKESKEFNDIIDGMFLIY